MYCSFTNAFAGGLIDTHLSYSKPKMRTFGHMTRKKGFTSMAVIVDWIRVGSGRFLTS